MIDKYVEEIRICLDNECYYAALALALTLPDICGSVEYPKAQVCDRYIHWSDKYIFDLIYENNEMKGMSGEALYNFRNMFLHMGNATVDSGKIKDNYNRIDKFYLYLGYDIDIAEMTFSIENKKNDKLIRKLEMVNVYHLCDNICNAALGYYHEHKNSFDFSFKVCKADKPIASVKEHKKGKPLSDDEILKIVAKDTQLLGLLRGYLDSVDLEHKTGE